MIDLPMFDDPPPPDNVVAIKPKTPRRKKPTKRKAAVRVAAPKKVKKKAKKKARALPAPKWVVKKRKARRGRPPGGVNKPTTLKVQPANPHAGGRHPKEIYDVLGALIGMSEEHRSDTLILIGKLFAK